MDLFVLFLCFSGVFVDGFGLESSIDVPVMNITVQEGHVAVLPCSVDYNTMIGYHKVEWKDLWSTLLTADDQRFVDNPRISIERPRVQDWNLQIRNTSYSDRGQYTCQIDTNPVKTKTVMLIVLRFGLESSFDDPVIKITVQEGDVAVLPCSVDYNTMKSYHKVEWTDQWSTLLTRDDQIFVDNPRISIERPRIKDWNLQIRKTAYSDRGKYKCQIDSNPVRTKPVMLIVLIPSKIVKESSSLDQTVREGDHVTLVCNVTGVPRPDVMWHRLSYEGERPKEWIGATREVLIIHYMTRYWDGICECVAYNGVGPAARRQINVSVYFAPEVTLPAKRIGQYLGREVTLDCESTQYPLGVMYWKKEDRDIDFLDKYRHQVYYDSGIGRTRKSVSLRIRNIQQDDFGLYTCYAENMIGNDKESVYLYGQGFTTLRSTSKAAAHDHVTLSSVLYVWSLITSTLVLCWR